MGKSEELRSRMIDLAKRSLKQTLEGKIKWTATDREDEYIYAGSNTSLSVENSNSPDDPYYYRFCLLNSRGNIVEQLSDEWPSPDHDVPWADLVQELYVSARRSALNIDALIDSAISDVDRGYESSDPWASTEESPF